MTDAASLFVVNPNSLQSVTEVIDAAVQPYREKTVVPIRCLTLAEGPAGIVSQRDADLAIAPLLDLVARLDTGAAGYVIACYSDPGLHSIRESTRKPVIGIGEAALLTACTLGQAIGVIAVSSRAIPRHLRYYGAMGLASRVVGERALELSVADSGDEQRAFGRMVDVGRRLRDDDGAEVVIMGCAGMSVLRDGLQRELGIPVVDPIGAGVGMALARL